MEAAATSDRSAAATSVPHLDWRNEYSTERPHSSLGNRTPAEFAQALATAYEKRVSLTEDSIASSY